MFTGVFTHSMRITVFDTAGSDEEKAKAEARLGRHLHEARIDARPRVILRQGRSLQEIMHVESRDADFALVGIELPEEPPTRTEGYRELLDSRAREFVDHVQGMLDELPTTILVHSAQHFEYEQVLLDRE